MLGRSVRSVHFYLFNNSLVLNEYCIKAAKINNTMPIIIGTSNNRCFFFNKNATSTIEEIVEILMIKQPFTAWILRKLCNEKGVEIIQAEAYPDHVYMLVSMPPKYSVSRFMGFLKGKGSLITRSKYLYYKSEGKIYLILRENNDNFNE